MKAVDSDLSLSLSLVRIAHHHAEMRLPNSYDPCRYDEPQMSHGSDQICEEKEFRQLYRLKPSTGTILMKNETLQYICSILSRSYGRVRRCLEFGCPGKPHKWVVKQGVGVLMGKTARRLSCIPLLNSECRTTLEAQPRLVW